MAKIFVPACIFFLIGNGRYSTGAAATGQVEFKTPLSFGIRKSTNSSPTKGIITSKDSTSPNSTLFLRRFCEVPAVLAHNLCSSWYLTDPGPPSGIEYCPPTSVLAQADPRYFSAKLEGLEYFHEGAKEDYRQKTPTPAGAGQQCVYDGARNLIVGPPNGGTADLFSPTKTAYQAKHILYDVLPWCYCCKSSKISGDCRKYYKKRPSDSGILYRPPAGL